MAKLVVIGGGSGFIGKALRKSLEKNGFKALIVSRNAQENNFITWDEIKKDGLPKSTHAVINLAGEPAVNPLRRWGDKLEADLRKSRIDTTELLRNSILNCNPLPKFWATISGVGFYPCHPTNVYDEAAAITPTDFWTQLTKEWEEAGQLPANSEVRHCTVRSGIVIGNGGLLEKMWIPYKLGLGGALGDGNQWFPWIHIDDIVGIFMHALTNDSVTGVLNGVAPEAITNKGFATSFASTLHRPAFFTVPAFVIKALLGSPRAEMLLEGQNVFPKRTLESGYRFAYPTLNEALQDIVTIK